MAVLGFYKKFPGPLPEMEDMLCGWSGGVEGADFAKTSFKALPYSS